MNPKSLLPVFTLAALLTNARAYADGPQPTAPSSPPAASASQTTAQALAEEGAAFYRARDYRRANDKFQQAYAVDPDPNLLYNMAKCYEALGDKQTAIEKYEIFINSPGADSGGRVRARAAVEVLKTPPPQAAPTPPSPAPPSPPASSPTPEPAGSSRLPAIVAFSVGGAGVAVGGIFGGLALAKQSDLDAGCKNRQCPPSSSGDISSLKSTSLVSTIGFAVGGVGIATGVVLLMVRGSSSKDAASISPYLGAGQAGLLGTF
jgi:hypothetical protein